MAKFKVAEGARIEHDGKLYEEGKSISLTDEQADPLLALGRIVDPNAPAEAPQADGGAAGA